MKTSVLVTAVAGSGKTTVCQTLQQLGYRACDLEAIDGLYELVDERTGQVIPGGRDQITEGLDWNCQKAGLQALLQAAPDQPTFYCGGMANTEDVWEVFDAVVVLTVSDATTAARLATRRPNEFGGTPENREWVLSWKHRVEQDWLDRGGIAVSAEPSPEVVARHIVAAVLP